MEWSPLNPARLDWLHLPADPGTLLGPIDPYLVWADLTDFKGFGGVDSAAQRLPVAIQVWAVGHIPALVASGLIESPPVYRGASGRIFTAQVRPANLPALAAHSAVRRVELGLPLASLAGRGASLQEGGNTLAALPGADDCVVGVIDFGCPFLNRAFCTDASMKSTRLVAVWQQEVQPSAPWSLPAGFGYGRELGSAQVDDMLATLPGDAGRPAAELASYQAVGYLYDGQGRPLQAPHGSLVLDIAGGRFDPQLGAASAKPQAPDAAEQARLVFVDVPRPGPNDTSGAPLCVHIIDALHYIVDRAGKARNIVINLSIGAQAGPHDGSSIIEEAIDELVETLRRAGRTLAVVVSAGNMAEARCHAEGELPPSTSPQNESAAALVWRVLPEDDTDSYLEIWYDCAEVGAVSVELETPFGATSGAVELGQARCLIDSDEVCAVLLHCREPAVGAGPMALLAVAPAKASARRPGSAPHGPWTVTIRNASRTHAAAFYAWVERDDTPIGAPVGRRQSVLADKGATRYVDGRRGTVNNIGTGNEAIVVAASDLATRTLTRYSGLAAGSGAGSSRRQRGPHLMASADESPSVLGLVAAGNLSGSRSRMSGTSIAAPVAARAIANLLSRPPFASGGPPSSREALIEALMASNAEPAARAQSAPGPRRAMVTRFVP